MKRIISFSSLIKSIGAIFLIAITFSACKKNSVDVPAVPAAGVMAFNLIPDKTIGFTVSGSNLTNTALGYTNYTGAYLPVYPGAREVSAFSAGSGTTLATTSETFMDSMYYSVFAIGLNGSYKNIITEDHLNSLTVQSGKSYVRYINAITDSTANPNVSITSGGSPVINTSAAYSTVSAFAAVPKGDVTIAVADGAEINNSRTITLEENKVYTVLLLGTPGATDPDNSVQIKFITNGIVN
ncbi:MAG: DUF4397 domain-containing protein [Ferruginibacter sp.]